MTQFSFDSITSAEALAYSSASDTIAFPAGATAASVSVIAAGGQVIVTSGGQSVSFGAGFTGQTGAIFGDGSKLYVGGGGADQLTGAGSADAMYGAQGDDGLNGADGTDTLHGGSGDDQLRGGRGVDQVEGGLGVDTFLVFEGDTTPSSPDVITDWSSEDRIGINNTPGAYQETSAPDAGRAHADSLIAAGARYVAVQTPGGVIVYIDTAGNGGGAEDALLLSGRTLDDISGANLGALSTLPTAPPPQAPPPTTPPPTTPPTTPTPGTPTPETPAATVPALTLVQGGVRLSGSVQGNMDLAQLANIGPATILVASPSEFLSNGAGQHLRVTGGPFDYPGGTSISGLASHLELGTQSLQLNVNAAAGTGIPTGPFADWFIRNATQEAFTAVFFFNDNLTGAPSADLIRGYGGNDIIAGAGGGDTVFGGLGNDVIYAVSAGGPNATSTAQTYLRGDEGDDYLIGAAGFDDINGNMGNDTVSTGAGEDYCVGGKDNDLLFGDAAYDLVYGNLGNDTCEGGDGNDIVRGGQENDIVRGGNGDDFVSGDKGDDTMTGGAGADSFHTFGDAGLDRVIDFNLADGDRVQLDPGTQYAVSQVGADTVIDMTGGGKMILVGVQMSSLTPGWIFGA